MPRNRTEPVFDVDNPEWTYEDFATAKPASSMPSAMAAQFPNTLRRGRGPQKAPTKVSVHMRLSQDVLDRFKADGPGWQGRIDLALRKVAGL